MFISLTFNRSRLALASVNVCLAYAFIQNGLQSSLQETANLLLYTVTVMLFCIHLCLISLYRERGSLTIWGISRVLLIFGSYLSLWWLFRGGYADTTYHSIEPLLHDSFMEQANIFPELTVSRPWITRAWVMTFLLSGVFLVTVSVIKRSSIEFALVLGWLSGMFVFYDFARDDISVFMFSVLMIALFVAFIQITYDLAYVDTLTELPGRRALVEKLGTLGGRYTIAMVDVDHFKKFNDTYGHDVGDQVLKLVASFIKKVKGRGTAYRYGGEEFTILFNRKSAAHAEPFLNDLRQAIQDYTMIIRDRNRTKSPGQGARQRNATRKPAATARITVSIGASERRGRRDSPENVMAQADAALYKAKNAGRNRVIIDTGSDRS